VKHHIESRFEWAVAEMDIHPGHKVLEIGPGTGIALEIIARRVSAGSIVALDQSHAMIAKAQSRLKRSGLDLRVKFITDSAETVDLSRFRFDRVLAFNVNIFYKETDLNRVLDPVVKGGVIGIFYQNPPGSDRRRLVEMLAKVQSLLEYHRFEVVNLPVYDEDKATPTGGVLARKR
jgi:tRNA A58 N-methylase Trm61